MTAFMVNTTIEWEHNKEVQNGSNKLRTYINIETEMYLNKPMAFNLRKCFFHVEMWHLRIETGRYERLPVEHVEQRVFEVCDSNNVEDEMHFLISCNLFRHERTELYANVSQFVDYFNELSLEDKFIFLMSDHNICTFIARPCHDMLRKRWIILYK